MAAHAGSSSLTAQRIAKWTRWIEGRTIRDDVLNMHLQRDAWREVSKIIQDHGHLPDSYWWEFMLDTYMTTQAVAIRRQADICKDVASLAKLLQQLRGDPKRVTRDFWIELNRDPDHPMDEVERRLTEQAWADKYGGGEYLDPEIPIAT
jgi:hypothetical protein